LGNRSAPTHSTVTGIRGRRYERTVAAGKSEAPPADRVSACPARTAA
jgi:hypothetical protein